MAANEEPAALHSPVPQHAHMLPVGCAIGPAEQHRCAPELPTKIPSLDGLRAVAIGLVILAHGAHTWGAPRFLAPLAHVGNLGVRIFFVISGFLITTLLLRELDAHHEVSLKNFYARRSLRILPAFFIYVAAIQMLSVFGMVDNPHGDTVRALTFTMDYRDDKSWPLNHLWSLSVEEQFYLLWGVLFLVASQPRVRLAVLVLAVVPLGVRSAYLFGLLTSKNAVAPARQFECLVDALAMGALLSVFFNTLMSTRRIAEFARSPLSLALGAALTLAAVASYLIDTRLYDSMGQTVANIGITLILWNCVTASGGWVRGSLNWRPIAYIGVLSYSLYLWQQLFLDPISRSFYARFPVNIAFAFCAAFVSYYAIERPFLHARRYFRSRAKQRAPQDEAVSSG